MSRIHLLHENEEWLPPFHGALSAIGAPYEEWMLVEGSVDLNRPPPPGVYYSRMSASAHTRGHASAPHLASAVLHWLELHGRTVFNGTRALALEVSKVAQYTALEAAGIAVPRTIAAVGRHAVLHAAEAMKGAPFILKPNRGGKGAGVRLFHDRETLDAFIADAGAEEQPVDDIWLVQEYVASPEPFITRCEFVDGEFLYAVRVDTSDGFELCPADHCEIETATACMVPGGEKFRIIPDYDDPVIDKYRRFLAAHDIRVAGIEHVRNAAGRVITYDVNTNTNYNAGAEKAAGVSVRGPEAVARALVRALEAETLKRAS